MKKILLSLFVSLIGLTGFSNGMIVEDLIQKICPDSNPDCNYTLEDVTVSTNYTVLYDFGANSDVVGNVVCLRLSNFSTASISDVFLGFATNTNNTLPYNSIQFSNSFPYQFECIYMNGRYFKGGVKAGASPITFDLELFVLNELLSTSIPEKTSLECQTEYNLIPVDSVDSAYCENNNLCPVYTGEVSTGYSTLYINDIRHQSMPFIYLNIPEEFNRTYSTGINDFTIDVEGYNVDTEYIDGIIRTQNYKPSSEDFTNLVGLLAPYTKYLVFLLFVFVLWAWIKNSFKSKKL